MATPVRSPRDPSGRFVNWAGTVVTTPNHWREPASEDAIVELVRAAIRDGQRLQVVGAGHSWSAVAAPDDVAVSLDRHSGVAVDAARGVARVRGGTRLVHLNEALAEQGFALSIVGSVAHQSIAGVIGTGTHGSSLVHGNLSSHVVGMRLVSGTGEVVVLDAGDPRLEGARVHLGALGIVSEVTVKIEPAFRLAETVADLPVEAVARDLSAIAKSAEYVKVWWLPHTPRAQVFRYARTGEPPTTWPSAATQRRIDEGLLHGHVFRALIAAQRTFPEAIPRMNRVVARTFDLGRRVGPSALMLSTPMPVVHRETEAALPLARSGDAFDRMRHMIDREGVHMNFPVELRFVPGDAGWLSPAHGVDTCQIGAYAGGIPGIDRYFAGFWRVMRAMSARPHWGKELDHGAAELSPLYPAWDRFRALRDQLDPDRRFATPFRTRTLGA